MPKPIKKKIRKKAVVREEKVTGKLQHVMSEIRERQRPLTYILAALALILILAIVYFLYASSARKDAHAYEIQAYDYYYQSTLSITMSDEERWKKALELLQKSYEIKETPAVLFYAGNCYFNLGDYENAVKTYNTFTKKFSDEELVLPLVYQKLSSALLKQGKTDLAVKAIRDLGEFKSGTFRDTALILEARHLESSGKIDDALLKYEEVLKHFPASPWVSEAQARVRADEERKSEESHQSLDPAVNAETEESTEQEE